MSVIIHTRGEVGGGVAAHLQCSHCGHLSRSHAHQLAHMAADHPALLDDVMVGRLGNILIYQGTAKLFHCASCFYTSKDFNKIYTHIISNHCVDQTQEEAEGEKMVDEDEEEKMVEEEEKMEEESQTEEKMVDKRNSEGETMAGELEKEKTVDNSEKEEKVVDETKEAHTVAKMEGEEKIMEEVEKEVTMVDKIKGTDKKAHEGEEDKMDDEVEENDGVKIEMSETGGGETVTDYATAGLEDSDIKPDVQTGDCVLMFDGAYYHCLICSFRNKMKVLGLNHVVRKHKVPRTYAIKAIRNDKDSHIEEDGQVGLSGLSKDLMKEEKAAIAKVSRFSCNRYECLLCGWRTKVKGFVISHVVRSHNVERPYHCKHCSRSFFVPSRLLQHVRADHRPGRYACPFCCFRTDYMGGFRRHCSRCNARELGEGEEEEEQQQQHEEEEEEERRETRGGRKRQRTTTITDDEEWNEEEGGFREGDGGEDNEEEEEDEEWSESIGVQRKRVRTPRIKEEEDE